MWPIVVVCWIALLWLLAYFGLDRRRRVTSKTCKELGPRTCQPRANRPTQDAGVFASGVQSWRAF